MSDEKETDTSQGTYRGITIYATSNGDYIVEYGQHYRAGSLSAAKKLIDDLMKTRLN